MTYLVTSPLDWADFLQNTTFAQSILSALMSMLVSSTVVHGHLPQSMNESVLVPITNNKNKRLNDKNNYRPI